MRPHRFQIGQPYQPGRRSWPEGVFYGYRRGQHELQAFLACTPSEVEAFQVAPLDLGLVVDGPAIVLLCRLQGVVDDWSPAPFSWFLERPAERRLPPEETSGEETVLLHMVLVNPASGIVSALRDVTLPKDFAEGLNEAIRAQAAAPWPGNAAYDRHLDRLFERETSEGLYRRAVATCQAGG